MHGGEYRVVHIPLKESAVGRQGTNELRQVIVPHPCRRSDRDGCSSSVTQLELAPTDRTRQRRAYYAGPQLGQLGKRDPKRAKKVAYVHFIGRRYDSDATSTDAAGKSDGDEHEPDRHSSSSARIGKGRRKPNPSEQCAQSEPAKKRYTPEADPH
jgi:hypothetical protein